jgi:hypothetical protein
LHAGFEIVLESNKDDIDILISILFDLLPPMLKANKFFIDTCEFAASVELNEPLGPLNRVLLGTLIFSGGRYLILTLMGI